MLALGVLYMHSRQNDKARIHELEAKVVVLQKQGETSELDRSVSEQMEDIAHGQQALSEERSQEAIRQSEIAEAERQHALRSQAAAETSAKEAMHSYQVAEQQRKEADNQRQQAEHAKLVADTLNYISLGRTLGSQSYSIYQTGNTELGNMLAYASYLYTNNYGGDLYTPAVFQALIQSAGGRHSWNSHNGSISRLAISPRDHRLLTVSTFGEIFSHQIKGEQMQTSRLMSDKAYWFNDLYAAPDGKVYAISYTGQLVITDGQQTRIIVVENVNKPFCLQTLNDGKSLLVVGENSIALFDIPTEKIMTTRRLDFQVTCTGRRDNKPLLFDNRGHMHLVNSLDKMTNEQVPVRGKVTAYANNREEHLTAYGMADGTQKNAVTLYQSAHWLNDFTFINNKDYIMVGEHNGTVTRCLISLPKIAQRLRQNVKRNFTQEEWNYYVGKGIPYRKVKE